MTKEEREKEIERVDQLMPQQPGNKLEVLRFLEDRALLKGNRIIYKAEYCWIPLEDRSEQMILCHCSACGERWFAEKINAPVECHIGQRQCAIGYYADTLDKYVFDGDPTICPQCGADEEMAALHVSTFGSKKTKQIDYTHLLTVENVGSHLAVIDWFAERLVDKEGQITTELHPFEACVVIGGLCVRYNGYTYVYPSGDSWHHWRRRAKCKDEMVAKKYDLLVPFADELIAQTDADKSGFEDYCRDSEKSKHFYPANYLMLWCKYPQAENLARTGYGNYLNGMIMASKSRKTRNYTEFEHFSPIQTRRFCDWKKVRPNEILHMGKEDYKRFAGRPFNEINLFQQVSDVFGVRISDELMEMAKYCGTNELRDILKAREKYGRRVSPEKVIRYCFANKRKVKGGFRPNDLLDHWRIVAAYYGELPESLMYPKRFAEEHRKFSDLLTSSGKNKWDADVAMQAEVMMKYAWGDPETGLRIFPAKSETELKNEGIALNHCVGTYAESMARGETTIFFIRRIRDPKTPYFTLEFKNGAVEQNRGKKNCGRTPDVEAFEKKWIAHVKEVDAVLKKMKQEEKQRGKSDANGKRGDAAA